MLPGVVAPRSARSVSVPSAMSCDPALPRICSSGLPGCAAATAAGAGRQVAGEAASFNPLIASPG